MASTLSGLGCKLRLLLFSLGIVGVGESTGASAMDEDVQLQAVVPAEPAQAKGIFARLTSWIAENWFKVLQGTGAIAFIFTAVVTGANRIWTTREFALINYNDVPFFVGSAIVPFRHPNDCISAVDDWAKMGNAEVSAHPMNTLTRVLRLDGTWMQVTCIGGQEEHSFAVIAALNQDNSNLIRDAQDLQSSISKADTESSFSYAPTKPWLRPNIGSSTFEASIALTDPELQELNQMGTLPLKVRRHFSQNGFNQAQCFQGTCSFFKPGFSIIVSTKRLEDKNALQLDAFIVATSEIIGTSSLGMNLESTFSFLQAMPGIQNLQAIGRDDRDF